MCDVNGIPSFSEEVHTFVCSPPPYLMIGVLRRSMSLN